MATFYHLFKTTCIHDGSAFFGIHGNDDPMWDQNVDYVGRGPKLFKKIDQYGGKANFKFNFRVEVLFTTTSLAEAERHIKTILTPATYADPLCLNVSPEEMAETNRQSNLGVPKSELHKQVIATSLVGNNNALGAVASEEKKQAISDTRTNAKLKWIHNPETREELQLPADEIAEGGMLTGFVLGRLPKHLKEMGPVPHDPNKKIVDY